MPITEKHLFDQFSKLAKKVKQDFKNKGLVVPTQKKDGTIQVGDFTILKKNHVFYIANKYGEPIVGPLNLPQTAVITANDLALGRWPDVKIIDCDKWYGYKAFEEQVATNLAEKARKSHDADRADFSLYEASVAANRKAGYKKSIDARFNKLCKLT